MFADPDDLVHIKIVRRHLSNIYMYTHRLSYSRGIMNGRLYNYHYLGKHQYLDCLVTPQQ
jgi:hypothetical protein